MRRVLSLLQYPGLPHNPAQLSYPPLAVVLRLGSTRSCSSKTFDRATEKLAKEEEDLRQRVEQYKNELRKHVISGYKHRELQSNITNLQLTMADAERKKARASAATANTIANIPSSASIEVLSNGTTHMPPCVAIRTPLKTYLFNCPEGTSRFLPALRLKSQNIYDMFITRGVWQNIGGISSILLMKDNLSLPVRLHGTMNMKHFLECIRPFQDSDFGSVKYPTSKDPDDPVNYPCELEECTLATHDGYEDAGLCVQYVPLLPGDDRDPRRKNPTDVAFLIHLKAAARKIDIRKVMELKVPKGPLIGQLKNMQPITLPDGTTVHPEDVLLEEGAGGMAEEKPRVLIVDCATKGHTQSLIHSEILAPFCNGGTGGSQRKLNYVVHFTTEEVMATKEYIEWKKSLGPQCTHIIVNGSGPVVPGIDSMYRHNRLLHRLQPALFDELRPRGWRGLVTKERDLGVEDGQDVRAAPLQRWWMRMDRSEDAIVVDLKEEQQAEEWEEKAKEAIERATAAKDALLNGGEASPSSSTSFPRITFLGTSSATPSKYRNVSSYLFETGPSAAFLVDVGEGTYGQLLTILDEECENTMLNLHALFITHAHQDHMNGLYTIIEKRRDAFQARGLPYRKLVVVCNKNVKKPLDTYSHCFEDLNSYVEVIDLSTGPGVRSPVASPTKRPRYPPGVELPPTTLDMIAKLPEGAYDAERWQLKSAVAVQVHHTRMANGFVFTAGNGTKVVFSGDTKPCDLLVQEGMNADLLIHESTFEDGFEVDALRKKHSTMSQAVVIGMKMKAKHTILTHFSARYPKVPSLPYYLDEEGVGVAMDGLRVSMDRLPLVPLLTPIYREAFRDELFEMSLKKCQRDLRENDAKISLNISTTKARFAEQEETKDGGTVEGERTPQDERSHSAGRKHKIAN